MIQIKGEIRGDYLHLECKACGEAVTLENLRWVGGVPQVVIVCSKCGERDDIKLWMSTWAKIVPLPEEGP